MEPITLPIYNTEGKEVDKIELNSAVFDGAINSEAMYQVVNCFRANQRKGLAATKTRGEVSGGGKKPWKQKGTGRARVGSIRSPLWRHGGVVFGPHPRNFYMTVPQKLKNVALRSSLNAKVKDNNLVVIEDMRIGSKKTKEAATIFKNLKLNQQKTKTHPSVLLLLSKFDDNLKLALRNIAFLDVDIAKNAHVYEIMSNKKVLITKDALLELTKRLKE
jgi:large subunit ribosomal protein L4